MKDFLNQFDLDNAFKALDELEYPTVKGGIRPNRVDLHEHFSRKQKTDLLIEEYYNVSSDADLEAAQEQREDEVAQAKLDRIEKIVDLDADSEEDLQAAYVGKFVVQCPQCMTLFYKKPEDVTTSEEDPTLANVGELCPNCSNDSGFTVVGKIEEATPEAAPVEEAPVEGEETGMDEVSVEGEETPAEGGEEDLDLDLDLGDLDLDVEETEEQEPAEESLNLSKALKDASKKTELDTENHSENLTLNESNDKECEDGKCDGNCEGKECDESINNSKVQKDASKNTELDTENHSENLTLQEDKWTSLSNDSEKIAIFFDCSGNNQWSPAQVSRYIRNYTRTAQVVDILYFSDTIYPTPYEARQSSETSAGPAIIAYAKEHPDYKIVILCFDDDLKGQGGAELYDGSIPNVEIINVTKENPTEIVMRDPDNPDRVIKVPVKDGMAELTDKNGKKIKFKVEEALHLTESTDIKKELKAYNEYIEYLQKEIEADEAALKTATNDFVKDSIQRRIDANKADLDSAMPQILKDAVDEQDVTDETADGTLADLDIEADVSTDAAALQDEAAAEEEEVEVKEALNEACEGKDCGKDLKEAAKPEATKWKVQYYDGRVEETDDFDAAWEEAEESGTIQNIFGVDGDYPAWTEEEGYQPFRESCEGENCKEDVNILSGNSSSIDLGDAGAAIGAALPLLADDEGEKLAECDKTITEAGEPSEAELDQLYNSPEFRTPVAQSTIDKFFGEGVEDDVEIKDIEELDDKSLTEAISGYLKEVYEDVNDFSLTECQFNEETNQLIVEGLIKFDSGKTKTTKFMFNPCGANCLEGYNFDICDTKAFTLGSKLSEDKKTLFTESLGYHYHIKDDLVEGLIRN